MEIDTGSGTTLRGDDAMVEFAVGVLRLGAARFDGPVVGERFLVATDAICVNATNSGAL